MNRKSWHLDRRTVLRGVGTGLALPWLECMSSSLGAAGTATKALPKRLCAIYIPYGVSLPKQDSPYAKWRWFPNGSGKDFTFNESLKSLEPLRDKLTVFEGLDHPKCRKMGGHDTADTFLTGAEMIHGNLNNTVSVDQLIANEIGDATRYSSLSLSTNGGVGTPTKSTTLAFSQQGRPIPSMNRPMQIFARLFGVDDSTNAKFARQQLANSEHMLDSVLEHSKDINRKLGRHDQQKFQEYLDSVRMVEQQAERAQAWMDIPKPKVDPETLKLNSSPEDPIDYLRTMFDLMALAFQTDSTRVATFMTSSMGNTLAGAFPAAIGLTGNWHKLAHDANKGSGPEELGKFDQFLAENFSRFLQKLDAMDEGDGSVLDRTAILYGSSNSNTHNNTNYPLILAGGNKFGFKHGHYRIYDGQTPMSNLLLTMLNGVGVEAESFADSTGRLDGIV